MNVAKLTVSWADDEWTTYTYSGFTDKNIHTAVSARISKQIQHSSYGKCILKKMIRKLQYQFAEAIHQDPLCQCTIA